MSTIQAINDDPQALSVTPPKSIKGGLKIANLNWNKKPICVQLATDLSSVSTPFAPSVFGGGEADRKGILFNISDEIYEALYEFEQHFLKAMKEDVPDMLTLWHTAISPAERYSATLKAKINAGGEQRVSCYNADQQPVEEPPSWRRLPVNAFICIRGCYIQKAQAGFLIDVTHLQYGAPEDSQPESCPFR